MSKIVYLESSQTSEDLIKKLKLEGSYTIYIKGSTCKNVREYFSNISQICNFPIPAKGWDGYNDWMRDFFDIKEDKIALVIDDFNIFLSDDWESKIEFISNLETVIFPWWDGEVLDCVVDGKTKEFTAYLIE